MISNSLKSMMNIFTKKNKPSAITQRMVGISNPFKKSPEQLAWEHGAVTAQDFTNKFIAQLEAKIIAQLFTSHPVPMEYWQETKLSLAYIEGCKDMVSQELELWKSHC